MEPALAITGVLLIALAFLLRRSTAARDSARKEAATLQVELASERSLAAERYTELERLRSAQAGEADEEQAVAVQLESVREGVGELARTLDGTQKEAAKAAAGTERIDSHLMGFTKRLANPQSRGAFGEEALRNQLEMLGLKEGRDYERQVRESGGKRRIDYALRLREATIGLDPKFALEPDLEDLSTALGEGDEERLAAYGKKLVAHGKDLARKEYWAHLERSPSFVLMYVPVEGAHEAMAAVPKLSYEKFAIEHGVYVVTPLQLGTTLGVIADVAHETKRAEEAEAVLRELLVLDQELGKFCEQYAKHGRQLASAVASFNGGAAMLGNRGGLGRIAGRIREHARRRFKAPAEPKFEPVREDVPELADHYQEAARLTASAAPGSSGDRPNLPDAPR